MSLPYWLKALVRLPVGRSQTPQRGCRRRFRRRTRGAGDVAVEILEDRTLLAAYGVTLITHGFNSNADAWVNTMADEVIARVAAETEFVAGDVAKYELTIDANTASLVQESAQSYLTATSGETVIRLDWGALAGTLLNQQGETSTDEVAPRIANYIFGSQSWIVQGTLHLIGHSRGASLIAALAAEFGTRGVWVDQSTFLDSHPRTASEASDPDYPMNTTENVVFADGYWRQGSGALNPDGEHVSGAFNIQLNEAHFAGGSVGYGGFLSVDTHADVHLWYHGTVDNVGGFSDGEETVAAANAGYWFAPEAYDSVDGAIPEGRNDTGYAFSRVVGIDRPVAGVSIAIGGSGARTAIDWTGANWPNLLELSITAPDLEFDVGEPIPVTYYFQDADSNADLTFFLDVDGNPHNGNAIMAGGSIVQTGGSIALTFDNENIPTSGMAPGNYYVAARIADAGGRQRWIYAPGIVTLNSTVDPPEFTGATINGGSANRSGIREIALTFSEGVTITSVAGLNLFNHTTGMDVSLNGSDLVDNGTTSVRLDLTGLLTPLPDGRYTLELPASETTPNLASMQMIPFWKLAGDIDGDGAVNFNDTVPLSLNFGVTGAAAYSDGDGDGDGNVNFNDTVPLSLNFGNSLPPLMVDSGLTPRSEVEDHQVESADLVPDAPANLGSESLAVALSPAFTTFEHPLSQFTTNRRSRAARR